jgi:hypothetical protein
MSFSVDRRLILLALPALAACADMPGGTPAASTAPPDAYAGKGVIDAGIAAMGGEAALKQVKELYWTGSATVTAAGKTTEIDMETIVRPFTFARTTSWPKGARKGARSIQAEYGEAWTIQSVSWTPLPAAQAENENQQFALYGVMLLTSLKDSGAKVTETAPGKDGTRNLHVEHAGAPPIDLRFDGAGKLIRAEDSVRDPTGGAAPLQQVATFSGSMTSNGVTWPKKISIQQNGQPFFDLELASFEARPAVTNAPIPETLGSQDPSAPASNPTATSPTARQ